MADHVDITLWIDRRWKDAIEKHLKDETLQEHLENVLDTLCNQLPEQEYKRISSEIYAEDAAEREAREAARTYAAYHVTERGQEWYFKTSPGEELLVACPDSPSHGEHWKGARRIRCELRQAGVLRRAHHGRLANLGDEGCLPVRLPCHKVALCFGG